MEIFYLKNQIDDEIVDVFAESIEAAKKIASEMLGGNIEDYIERF